MKKTLSIVLSLTIVGFLLSCNLDTSQPSQLSNVVVDADTSLVINDSVLYNTYLITFNYKNDLGVYVTQTVTTWVGDDPTGHIPSDELKKIKSIDTLAVNIPEPEPEF